MIYTFVAKMINDTAGSNAKAFFPFIFTLFMFVLFCNMIGMLPYSFTVTSHIIVTFVLAALVFVGVTILGFIKHGFGYLELFVPKGVPKLLLPLIIIIEIISYLSRPVSLSVRLFANMTAGHFVILGLIGLILTYGSFTHPIGLVAIVGSIALGLFVMLLEVFIALVQAYIFAMLVAVFIGLIRHAH